MKFIKQFKCMNVHYFNILRASHTYLQTNDLKAGNKVS